MNLYTQAVNVLKDYVAATDNVFSDGDLPDIETQLEYALKVLQDHEDYDERVSTQ